MYPPQQLKKPAVFSLEINRQHRDISLLDHFQHRVLPLWIGYCMNILVETGDLPGRKNTNGFPLFEVIKYILQPASPVMIPPLS